MNARDSLLVPSFSIENEAGRSLLGTGPLSMPLGGTIAVTGPSGSGKTLFLKSLFGWTGTAATLSPVNRDYFMIQDPSRGLTPGLSLAGHFRDVAGGRSWRSRARTLMLDLGFPDPEPDFWKRAPHTFSGGERQRIMLALILMNDPRILVCDEPASSLDPENETRLWAHLQKLKKSTTLIFVTHRLDLIERYADHVLVLNRGGPVFQGPVQDFFEKPRDTYHRSLINVFRSPTLSGKTGTRLETVPMVEVQGVSLRLGRRWVLRDFSVKIESGTWLWLEGPSGSGKTSLARILAGLLAPTRGSVMLDGRKLAGALSHRSVPERKAVQYVFQHGPLSLNPALSVKTQLKRAYDGRTEELCGHLQALHLGMPDLDHPPIAFSLGEVQRINLVRALAPRPRLLICDELFASLDLVLRRILLEFLERVRVETGVAVLIITHNRRLTESRQAPVIRLTESEAGGGIPNPLKAFGDRTANPTGQIEPR